MVNTLHPPPDVIASWPKPNYVDPETRGPALFNLCIVLGALAILTVTARLYSRLFITKALGVDDGLIVIALGFAVGVSIFVAIGTKTYGTGRHIWDVPLSILPGERKNVFISEWCYVTSLTATKISVLLFYRRLSVSFSRTFVVATWIGIIYNILYLIGFGLALLLICSPVHAYWDSFNPVWAATHKYRCNSEQASLPLSAAFSFVGDLYSAILPMLVIVGLQLPRRQKLSLYALFSLAFLVVGAGITRTVLLYFLLNVDYDLTWTLWETWIWALVEMYLALLAASAPALKPFFRKFLVEPIGTVVGSSKRKHGDGYENSYLKQPRSKGWSSSGRDSAPLYDAEHIGLAYGGPDTAKSREESFVREVDSEELETRHYQLRQSRDGSRIVPIQVWKANNPPLPHSRHASDPSPGHVRNFSQPHSYTSSDATAAAPRQMQRTSSSQGSVKTGRMAAQRRMHLANAGDPQHWEQRWPISDPDEHDGRGSRLDPPSDESDVGWYDPEQAHHLGATRVVGDSRSGSDETLQLPRMGSKDMLAEYRNSDPERGTRWGGDIGHGRHAL